VNWLTHAKNAVRMDAEIGLKAVEHLLGMYTAARHRTSRTTTRCPECGSYRVIGGVCRHCDWTDPSYDPPELPELSEEERARRLAQPHTPTSDISTFMSPDGVRRQP
jgi:ribosomal protein L32